MKYNYNPDEIRGGKIIYSKALPRVLNHNIHSLYLTKLEFCKIFLTKQYAKPVNLPSTNRPTILSICLATEIVKGYLSCESIISIDYNNKMIID